MKIAITWSDSFIAPYIIEMLGPAAVVIPNEILNDQTALDAMLTPCSALIHINSWTTLGTDRDDDVAYRAMREEARPILDAVDRHGGLHMIILGTLRVYPKWDPAYGQHPFYDWNSSLDPQDAAAGGQLWMEETAMERAQAERPVSILRVSNVQGIPLNGPPGNGILHRWAEDCNIGFGVTVPGDGTLVKDLIHIHDLLRVIDATIRNPPPTRESMAIGSGQGIMMNDLADLYRMKVNCDVLTGGETEGEVFGVVDGRDMEDRFGFRPQTNIEQMIDEAFSVLNN
jgi:nucleoside-diphosphate-sugar epimerase